MKLRTTHTVVELPLSLTAYAEIASKLRDAGYDHCFGLGVDEGLIDMTGLGVRSEDTVPPMFPAHIDRAGHAVHKRESAVSTDEPNDIGIEPADESQRAAVSCALKHADVDGKRGETTDHLALMRLAEEVRRLRRALEVRPCGVPADCDRDEATKTVEFRGLIGGTIEEIGVGDASSGPFADAQLVDRIKLDQPVTVSDELQQLRELANSVKAAQEALDQLQSPAAEYASSYSAGMKLCAHIGWIKTELEELRELRTEVEHFLDHSPFAVRVCEGAGPENFAQSIAVTIEKIDREMTRLYEIVEPLDDHSQLMKRLPHVRPDFLEEIKGLSLWALQKRVLIQCDWLGAYSRCADGLDLTIDKRPINGSGVESARDPRDIRRIIEEMIKKIGLKDELIDDLAKNVERMHGLINSPQIESFDEAVKLEAAHQIMRWGSDHDAGKTDVDFLFLIGFLGGKAVEAGKILEKAVTPVFRQQLTERRLHHIIAAAAAARNWHLQRIGGDKRMRPGILPPQGFSEEEEQAFGLPTPERTPPMPPTESGARELRAEADRLGVDIPKEVSVAGVFTVEKGAAVVKGEPVDVVREFTSETEERAARLDAAAATGSVEHYTSVVESMIEEDEAKASLREGSTVRVPGVGEL